MEPVRSRTSSGALIFSTSSSSRNSAAPSSLASGRGGVSNSDAEWNLARMAANRPEDKDTFWRDVRRVSLMFPSAGERAAFGGTPNVCHCKTKTAGDLSNCLKAGHKGVYGQVQEFWRKQAHESHQIRFESQKQVVKGQMRDDAR